MARIVVGLFDRLDDAQACVRDLEDNGFPRNDISLVAKDAKGEYARQFQKRDVHDDVKNGAADGAGIGAVLGGLGGLLVGLGALAIPGIGPVLAAGPIITTLAGAGIGAAAGGLIGALVDAGIPENQAKVYAEGVNRGGTLVTVNTSDDMASKAADIMNSHHPIDVNRRAAEWQRGEVATDTMNAQPLQTENRMQAPAEQRDLRDMDKRDIKEGDTAVFPVIDEELRVGKREVDTGGVQVQSTMEEKPVEENVNLRREHVDVERHPVDRPASDADFNAFQEGTMEVREHSEEPIVEKRAHVVEEVEVHKDVNQEQQTVRDTVRHTDVDVNRLDTERQTRDMADEDEYDTYFRDHFNNYYNNTSYTYDQYRPYYEYGSTLANDPRYQGWTWDRLEPVARQNFQSTGRNANWNDVKEAIHEGWNRATHP